MNPVAKNTGKTTTKKKERGDLVLHLKGRGNLLITTTKKRWRKYYEAKQERD